MSEVATVPATAPATAPAAETPAPAAADKGDYLDQAVAMAAGKAGHATVCLLLLSTHHLETQ